MVARGAARSLRSRWSCGPANIDYNAGGTAIYDRQLTYDTGGRGLVVSETVANLQGGATITSTTTNTYGTGTSSYALGQVLSSTTATQRNGASQGSSTTTNAYGWGAGAQLTGSTIAQTNLPTYTTSFAYGQDGRLDRVQINDARARTITITSDLNGQAIRRDEADNNYSEGDPHDVWFRFGGREIGHTATASNRPNDYAASIAKRGEAPATGVYANASMRQGWTFTEGLVPLTSYEQGGEGGAYTVQGGETLPGIAAQLWGDSALWYKLAQANGLTGTSPLVAGQSLRVPAGVTRDTYNAATFRTFDPADALGDVSPVNPVPTGKAARKNKCGAFGQILLAVVAVAVTVASQGTLAGVAGSVLGTAATSTGAVIAGGALAGAAGSIASQGLGLATGLQDRFSFKGVALAALSGAVGGGLDKAVPGSGFAAGAARGAAGSAITQGVAIATGLQSRFDWAGVAVGGVVGGVGSWAAGAPAGSGDRDRPGVVRQSAGRECSLRARRRRHAQPPRSQAPPRAASPPAPAVPPAHTMERLDVRDDFAPPPRRQSFARTSCRMCLSRLRSVTSCLSLRFSSSSFFTRRSSPTPSPPYTFFQR